MTLVISTITSSGIVLTADSRQTYKNQAGAIRVGSDSAMKLFKLTNTCGVAISGRAFLNEKDDVEFTCSSDFDSLLYGAPRLVRNLTVSTRKRLQAFGR